MRQLTSGNRLRTTYTCNNAGDLASVSYNDGSTPTVTYGYDRRGRQSTVTRNGIIATLGYNDANELTGEIYTGGTFDGLKMGIGYDAYLRRTTLAATNGSTQLAYTSYSYDTANRLSVVSDGTQSATYSYLANSPLVGQITFKQNTTTRMTTTKSYDYLNRLLWVGSAPGSGAGSGVPPLPSFTYQYNDANQRIRATLADGSYWVYQYDKLGQVTSGKRYWNDGTAVAGQQFEYAFDDIGNRTSSKAGGDSTGANLRSATYSANTLNEHNSRTVPGAVDILGSATTTADAYVNTAPVTTRKGEYYHKEVSVANSSSAAWQSITVKSSNNVGQTTISGNLFLPQTPETFAYDSDGNMTTNGQWVLTWDGENRLIRLVASTAVGPQQRIDFDYDWKGRRISKKVWSNTSGTGTPAFDERFLYDNWNLIVELNATNNAVVRSYVWGLDLSGSLQVAGGVGGALFLAQSGASYCYAHDGNGNVVALVSASDASSAAQYEYDPFGNIIRSTGTIAASNPFRFSTKYQDDETGNFYYGYRSYSASIGRWPNRDPLGELGFELLRSRKMNLLGDGPNHYAFVRNNSVNLIDPFGLARQDAEDIIKVLPDLINMARRRRFACWCLDSVTATLCRCIKNNLLNRSGMAECLCLTAPDPDCQRKIEDALKKRGL